MKDNNIFFIIKIDYLKDTFEIKKEDRISYEELKQKSIKYFKIDKIEEKYLEFTYIDDDGDTNILSSKNYEIFEAAKEKEDGHFFLKLNLHIKKYNILDKLNEVKDEIYNNINNDVNEFIEDNNNKNKEKEIEKVKKDFNNKISLINNFYKKQIKNIHNEVTKIINNKYKIIEEQIYKLGLDIDCNINSLFKGDNNSLILNNQKEQNISLILNKENILKNENVNNNENIEDSFESFGDRIDIVTNKSDNVIKDYEIINQSKIISKNIINEKREEKDDFINIIICDKKDDFENIENNKKDNNKNIENNKNEKYNNKDNYGFRSYFSKISFKKQNGEINKKLEEIKNAINSLHKKPNIEKEDYINKGKEIFKSMQKYNINKNDIINFFNTYLFEKHKEKSKDEKIKYYIILKNINHVIDIEKINISMYNYFNEKENYKNIEIKNDGQLKDILKSLNEENNKYCLNLIETLKKNIKNEV